MVGGLSILIKGETYNICSIYMQYAYNVVIGLCFYKFLSHAMIVKRF